MIALCASLFGCREKQEPAQIVATTLPVYEFTTLLCAGTNVKVGRLITEDIGCLHDYTINVTQMQMLENAELLITSGAGLEHFLEDITIRIQTIDASENIPLMCGEHDHGDEHTHKDKIDPHYWLSPNNAKIMSENIYKNLINYYPEFEKQFSDNFDCLQKDFDTLSSYADRKLENLSCRELITFHDGFSYMADAFDLTILQALEEESGSEASASELISLINLVNSHNLPAVFIERNGSTSAASIIAAEEDIRCYTLDMAMSGDSYFDAMYHNIDTLSEALK